MNPTDQLVRKEEWLAASVGEFARLVQQGIDAWTKAGELLVQMIQHDIGILNKIRKEHPNISMQTLQAFERIGMKKVYAPLLADASIASRSLMELPYDQQVALYHGKIDVVVSVRNGKTVTKPKRLDEMTRDEVRMVFGKGCVHTIEQQVFRFKEIEAFEIQKEKPRPAFVDYKTVEVGYYVITLDASGQPTIKKAPASMPNAHSIRLIPFAGGEKAAVVLFYREPRK